MALPPEEAGGEFTAEERNGNKDIRESGASKMSRLFTGLSIPAMPSMSSMPAVQIPGLGERVVANERDQPPKDEITESR